MNYIKDFDNFLNEDQSGDSKVNYTFAFNFQRQMFSQKTGKWVDLKDINSKYLKEFISRMKEQNFNLMKDYEVSGVKFLEFDKPIDWQILNDVYRKIEDEWYKETSKL